MRLTQCQINAEKQLNHKFKPRKKLQRFKAPRNGQQNSGWKTGVFTLLISRLLLLHAKEGNKSMQIRSNII